MFTSAILLIAALLGQQLGPNGLQITQATHPAVSFPMNIHVGGITKPTAFNSLVTIGTANHLPMGIVVGQSPDSALCKGTLQFDVSDVSLDALIRRISIGIPGYAAELDNGVLIIKPLSMPATAVKLLQLQISEFRSSPEPLSILGSHLWIYVRGLIAPEEGTTAGGLSSTSVERVSGIQVKDQTVQGILDLIVDKGSGGVWIFDSAMLKELNGRTPMPYLVFGYVGEEHFLEDTLRCPSHN
jgi:hypothetical protein